MESIRSGNYHIEARAGTISALSEILGRTAAYAEREATWDDLIKAKQSYAGAIDLTRL